LPNPTHAPAPNIPGDVPANVVDEPVLVDLPNDIVDALIDDATDDTVMLDVRDAPMATEVSVPSGAVKAFGDAGLAMQIHLPSASVTISADTVTDIGQQARTDTITVGVEAVRDVTLTDAQNAMIDGTPSVYRVGIFDDGIRMEGLEGYVTLTLPSEVEDPTVWIIEENGTMIEISVTYDADNQTVTFTGPASSAFVIGRAAALMEPFLGLTIGQNQYTQNGTPQVNDVAPFIYDDTIMVPLRLIAEALGAAVEWHRETRSVTVDFKGETLTIEIDQALPNDYGTAVIVNGRTFVPKFYMAQMLGITMIWDSKDESIRIYRPA